MASLWQTPLAPLFFIPVLLELCIGERFFQYRDHRDQQSYEKHLASMFVHNKAEAEQQLEKYGYLHCRIRNRHRRSWLPSIFSEAAVNPFEGNLPFSCTSREIKIAIKQYQKKYNLPETGILDKRTKRFMSTSRCGNSDDDLLNISENLEGGSTSELLTKFIWKNNDKIKLPDVFSETLRNRPWKRSANNRGLLSDLLIAGKTSQSSFERRKKYLHEYINKLKREDPMMLNFNSANKIIDIRKRSVAVTEHIVNNTNNFIHRGLDGHKFEKQVIKWRLLKEGYSTRIPVEDQRSTLDLAFRMWSEVIPLKFVEETSGNIASVDIEVAFGTVSHQNCKRNFDGHGGEIAHSFSNGNMHFDDDEFFKTMRSFTSDGIYLLRVAVHEIGHVLGLMHTNKKYSIMYAIYEKENSGPEFELGWEDRKAVQRVYGVCKGRFNTVFDWVRKNDKGKFIFNTYFFRGNHYWMYENHANRTRYGDPLYITSEWNGVPDEPDGYAQVLYVVDNNVVDDVFFYKGEDVYKYDSQEDKVSKGWPKKIKDVHKARTKLDESIPDHLNTVFFDPRDKNMYFFKNDMVYVYDPREPKETQGCCVRKNKLTEEYPAEEGSISLPASLDAVYYSFLDDSMYFIKDDNVWKNMLFSQRKGLKNEVKYIGKWFDKWFDICDVTTHSTHVFDFQTKS